MIVYELPNAVYLNKNLISNDGEFLEEFLEIFSSGLVNRQLDSAILAVGSSTFPSSHWKRHAKFNLSSKNKFDDLMPLVYEDIDLRIVPANVTSTASIERAVKEVLQENKYCFEDHRDTNMGTRIVSIDSFDEEFECTFPNIAYGLHSITTKLKNGRSLDLILDYDDKMKKRLKLNAQEVILQERANNGAFSVLYLPQILKE